MVAITAILLSHTGTTCSNPNLRAGYELINSACVQLALAPLRWVGARAPRPGDPPAAGAACSSLHPFCILLAFAAIAQHQYSYELQHRRAFAQRSAAAGAGAAAGDAQLGSVNLLLNFVLPAVCGLYIYVGSHH